MVIIYPQDIRHFLLMVHNLSFQKWLYHNTKACKPAALAPSHLLLVCSLSTCSHFHVLGRSESETPKKSTHISFRPFFPPSDVSLFHTRLSTPEKIPSVFVSLSHSLKLLVNEIEVPFKNSLLVKNGTRRAILLLFTLVKIFELASQRYKFTTFSDHLD